jgi:hypothetical protein
MRLSLLLLINICLVWGCNRNHGSGTSDNSSDDVLRKEVVSIAEKYVNDQLTGAKKTIFENGIITIGNEKKSYVIDPRKIFTGLIDQDSKPDAIITIFSYKGQDLDLIEHLIIINTNDKLMLIRSIESDMKVLQLKGRVITTEFPKRPRSSPLYDCSSCQEIVKYRYLNGDLVKVD